MLRIAITAAGLVLATGAMAEQQCYDSASGRNCIDPVTGEGSVFGGTGAFISANPSAIRVVLQLPRCQPGWTLVDVAKAGQPTAHKCAAVGDLRDPE